MYVCMYALYDYIRQILMYIYILKNVEYANKWVGKRNNRQESVRKSCPGLPINRSPGRIPFLLLSLDLSEGFNHKLSQYSADCNFENIS
jgi:hypothetical protein